MFLGARQFMGLAVAAALLAAWMPVSQVAAQQHGEQPTASRPDVHAPSGARSDQTDHGSAGGAALHGDSGHGAKPKLLDWDLGSAFWSVIVFMILLVVLRATAWKPILSAMQQREAFIRDSLEQARRERESAEARHQEYVDKLNTARAEATAIVEEGRRDAEVLKRQIEETAKSEAASMIDRARREIGVATETAIKELYTASAKLATAAASRVIEKEIDAAHHERLIRDSISELSKSFARPVGGGTVADRR